MSKCEWTFNECAYLIRGICARAGVLGVQVIKNKRLHFGTCTFGWDDNGELVRKKIFLAEMMWTGEYVPSSRSLFKKTSTIVTSPELRLLTSLHEAVHMVLDFQHGPTLDAPHNKEFQTREWVLCREHGWTPVYVRCPGYAKMFTNLDTGEVFTYPGGRTVI